MTAFLNLLILLLLPTDSSAGRTLGAACLDLVKGNRVQQQKCVTHAEFYELSAAFIDECTAFHTDLDVRQRCLKSGANVEILHLCKKSGWTLNGTLTCLRSYPTQDVMKACKQLSPKEDEQISCVRQGRESAQVLGCNELYAETKGRLACLEKDVPVVHARECGKKYLDPKGRTNCLNDFVAAREGDYRRDQKELRQEESSQRALASEPKR